MVVAPARALRPGAAAPVVSEEGDDDPARCPFCEGCEGATPPETFALAPPGRTAGTPGWRVRVVPNRFPAFAPIGSPPPVEHSGLFERRAALGRQEVVVHTPRHVRSFADLSDSELAGVAEAWRARAEDARAGGYAYVQALVNEGRRAGASLAHSHSQLVWLPTAPPAVDREQRERGRHAGCLLCLVLAEERAGRPRVVVERDGVVLLCPYASRAPYELLLAPLACEPDAYASRALGAALGLLAEAVRRLRATHGPLPLNAWLHTSVLGGDGCHWHIEVLPRLTVFAGLELGAEVYVNPVAPEVAAAALRGS